MATLVYDGEYVKAYINDTLVGEAAFAGGAINASGYDVMLGRDPAYSNADFFNGSIDEVHIYSQALSDSEIKTLYYNEGGVLVGASIENNTLSNATVGMAFENVKGATVDGNVLRLSGYSGTGTPVGVFMKDSSNIQTFNSSVDGYYYDMQYQDVAFSTMHNVKIGNATSYGVYVDAQSHGNLFYNNSFYFNNGSNETYNSSHVQAYDAGTAERWNTTGLNSGAGYGNYWYDWNSTNPYYLDGGAVDYYPLATPAPVPVPEFSSMLLPLLMLLGIVVLLRRRK